MTDTVSFNAKVQVQSNLNRLITDLGNLEARGNISQKTLDRIQKAAVQVSIAMDKMSKAVSSGQSAIATQNRQLAAQQKVIQDLTRQYNALSKAQSAGSGTTTTGSKSQVAAQLKADTAATKKYASDLLASWQRQYDQRAAFTRDQTTLTLAGVARENSARKATMQTLQQEITQRYKLRDSISAAQVAYAGQVTRAGGSYGQDLGAIQAQNAAIRAQTEGLASNRYALYDVARTWTLVSAATLGASAAAVMVGASYESSLSQVQRTSQTAGAEFKELSADLIQISQDMPVAFSDVAGIASLAGQLGVASESVASFSETVARFAATTDVSTQAAATGIGRLAQLTQTSATKYENLASAIYQTGITSVATESQILSTASQIATAGNLAGFANTEIVALASSFASLGIAPERARGSIQRIFGLMTASASEGGEKLEKLAATAGMTAAQFASTWKTEPQVAFTAFVEGLGAMGKAGEDTNAMLKDMGIGAVRDIQALQALGNNAGIYAEALDQTSEAYASGTAVIDGYALVADDLLSILQKLKNTVAAVMAQVGDSEIVKKAASFLLMLAGAAEAFVKTAPGGFIAKLMLGLTALVGVFAAVQGGIALTRAAGLGMVQVAASMTGANGRNALSLRTVASALVTVTGNTGKATAASTAYTASLNAQTGAMARTRAAAAGTAAAIRPAAGYAAAFGGALKFGLWGAGFIALTAGITAVFEAMKSTEEKAKDLFGGASGLAEALREDTQAYTALKDAGESTDGQFTTFRSTVNESSKDLSVYGEELQNAAGIQIGLNDNTSVTTESVKGQTIAVGKLTKEWALNALTTGDVGEKLKSTIQEFGTELEKVEGYDLSKIMKMSLDPNQDVGAEIDRLIAQVQGLQEVSKAGFGKTLTGDAAAAMAALKGQEEALNSLKDIFPSVTTLVKDAAVGMQISGAAAVAIGVDLDDMGDSASGAAGDVSSLSDAFDAFVETAFGLTDTNAAVQASLEDLGVSLRDNGSSFSEYSEAGRSNLDALRETVNALAVQAGGDADVFAGSIRGLMEQLGEYGVDTQGELSFLQDMLVQIGSTSATAVVDVDTSAAQAKLGAINSMLGAMQTAANRATGTLLGGVLNGGSNIVKDKFAPKIAELNKQIASVKKPTLEVASAGTDLGNSMGRGFDKASKKAADTAKAAKKAADDVKEEMRTLVDYANDLGSVFQRAFDLRYGVEQGQDDIASQYEKIQKTAEDAAQAVADANQKIREIDAALGTLRTSNKTLEYQLSVAIEYGDTLRADEIRAKMGENNADISGLNVDRTQALLAEQRAQDAASKSLTANTAGGRANREMVLALVGSYQKQIQTLAASGLSTEELTRKTDALEREFVSQLTQMGYNRSEVNRYTQSFRDMSTVLANVPRNITVTANTNPAQQAINEFLARNQGQTVNVGLSASGGGTYNASGINLGGGAINAGAVVTGNLRATNTVTRDFSSHKYHEATGPGGAGGTTWFADGGFTGRGGKYEEAGTVHKGEFVVPQEGVNQSTGLPYQSYMSNMLPSSSVTSTVNNYSSGSAANAIQLVELLPTQLDYLAKSMNVNVGIDGATLANAVNGTNQQSSTRRTT